VGARVYAAVAKSGDSQGLHRRRVAGHYMIRARKGQILTVKISWRRKHNNEDGDNHAEFFVGELPNFDGDGRVKYGK